MQKFFNATTREWFWRREKEIECCFSFSLSLSLERPTTPTPVQSDVERNFNLYCGDPTLKEIFCKKVTSSLSADFHGAKCDPFFADESYAWWWYARCVEYASRILSFSLSFSSIIFWIMGWCFSNSSSPLLALLLCLLVLLLTKKKCAYNRNRSRDLSTLFKSYSVHASSLRLLKIYDEEFTSRRRGFVADALMNSK